VISLFDKCSISSPELSCNKGNWNQFVYCHFLLK